MKQLYPKISAALGKNPCRVVGGAVRDRLLGRPVFDLDLVVLKNPMKAAEKLARILKGSAFWLDQEWGVARVTLPGGQIDVAQIQGRTFEEDIDRRDFTINALGVPLTDWIKPGWRRAIIDRHHGVTDTRDKVVRAVAPSIFDEDPLRLLRAFRIAAELDFQVDSRTLALIRKKKRLMKKPSPERVREEMLKLFSTPAAHPWVCRIEECGLLDYLLPDAPALRRTGHAYYGKGGVLKHTLDSLRHLEEIFRTLNAWFPRTASRIREDLKKRIAGYPCSAHLKWGILLHDIGKPATAKVIDGRLRFFEHEHVGADKIPKLAARFRWSSDEATRYGRWVRNHMRPGNLATQPNVSDKAVHRFFRDLGDDGISMLLLSLGDHLSYLTPRQLKARNSAHEKVTIRMVNSFYLRNDQVLPRKLLGGYDLMKAFKLKPSPLIGVLLKDLTEAQTDGSIRTKEQALAYLRKRLPVLESVNRP